MAEQLSFREYILRRIGRYTPGGRFVQSAMKDERFLVIKSRAEFEAFVRGHNVALNEHSYADAVWDSYLRAKKRHARAQSGVGPRA
jgi:hypothetical protein